MSDNQQLRRCCRCGELVIALPVLGTETRNESGELKRGERLECPLCAFFMGWKPLPKNEKKRSASHRELVAKHSKGFCELCLIPESELGTGNFLVGHHVQEHSDGGTSDRDNVWIVCNACHSMIHWVRSHHGRNKLPKELASNA